MITAAGWHRHATRVRCIIVRLSVCFRTQSKLSYPMPAPLQSRPLSWLSLALLVGLCWATSDAAAQDPRPPGDLAIGITEQMRERQTLRPVATDPPAGYESDDPDATIQQLELDGMVVDETITRIGRDFYDAFFAVWSSPPHAINFTISIHEQPAPGLGTLIMIRANDEVVYQVRLQPQIEQIEAAALQGAGFTWRYLQNASAAPRIF
jgi:hypothetical protein